MVGIVEFLNARLNEDVVIAFMGEEWSAEDWEAAAGSGIVATHIARHDPARALREVTAKRALIAPHTRDDWYELADETTGSCESCSSYCDEAGCRHVVRWPCATLKAIAAVYADHEDYRTDW